MLEKLFKAIDNKDANKFVSFLTETARFRFASAPAVSGRDNIRAAVSQFFSSVGSLSHRISDVWKIGDAVICEGEVTYKRHDGSEASFPFANIFRMKGLLIADYRVYVDVSAPQD